jgi:DNA-binding GntR family transcriptional regulator
MESRAALIREDVYSRLRQEIISCALQPGAELREAELADRFRVSTSPVRDALLRLEADGLVVVFPRKGYRVAPISLRDASDLFDLRAVIEEAGAREAAKRAADAELATLDRFRHFDEASDEVEFVSYNRDFHCAALALSGNRRLLELGRNVIDEFDRLIIVSLAVIGHDRPRLVREHCAIIDALQERDGRRAAKLLAEHVTRAKKRVLDGLSRAVVA